MKLLIVLTASIVFADWNQFQNSPDNHGFAPSVYLNPATMDTVLRVDVGDRILASPVIMGDTIYAAAENGAVHAINFKTGELLWTFNAPVGVVSTPAADRNKLYVGARNGVVYALDRFSGGPAGGALWTFAVEDTVPAEKEIQASIKLANDRLYVGCFNGKLYCLDLDGNKKWDFQTHFYIKEAVAVKDSLVVLASRDEALYGLQDMGDSARLLWKNRYTEYGEYLSGRVFRSAPSIVDTFVFSNYAEAELIHATYAISANSGKTIQNIGAGFNTTGFAVAEDDGRVYANIMGWNTAPLGNAFTASGYYFRFMRSNAAPVALGNNTIVFHSTFYPQGIFFYNRATNAIRDSLQLTGYTVSSSFAAADSALFFGTDQGVLLGLGHGLNVTGTVDRSVLLMQNPVVSPNPFNPATTLRFTLAKSADVRIRIFNAAGFLVRDLSGKYPSGRGTVLWDGRDDNSRPLATGVYFIRAGFGKLQFTLRAVLIK